MTKFQKIQRLSGIIPFFSTFFVAAVTMYELMRRKAPVKIWFYFIGTLFLSGFAVFVLNEVILSGEHPFLNIIASGIILAAANIFFVEFQRMGSKAEQTRNKAKTIWMIIIIFAPLWLVGFLFSMDILLSSSHIEDINGVEDTSLAVITESEIVSTANDYSAYSIFTQQDGSRTRITDKMEEYDYEECSFRCEKLSGVMTLQATKTQCNRLTLQFSSKLEAGNAAIVILIDGEYHTSIPVNQAHTVELADIAGKTVLVKVAAESAKVTVSVKRIEHSS